jgi:hypothetical protein
VLQALDPPVQGRLCVVGRDGDGLLEQDGSGVEGRVHDVHRRPRDPSSVP